MHRSNRQQPSARSAAVCKTFFCLGSLLLGLSLTAAAQSVGNVRRFLYASDFTANAALTAWPEQTIVFQFGANNPDALPVRYHLSQATYRFCLEDDEDFITGITLENAAGQQILQLPPPAGTPRCGNAAVLAGVYTMRVTHSPGALPAGGRLAFAGTMSAGPPLADKQGNAVGGFWALQPNPTLDSQNREGRLRAQPPAFDPGLALYGAMQPLVADFSSTQIDEAALFSFSDWRLPRSFIPGGNDPPFHHVEVVGFTFTDLSGAVYVDLSNPSFFTAVPLTMIDLGKYQVVPGSTYDDNFFGFRSISYPPFQSPYAFVLDHASKITPSGPFRVLFRFFPDGSQVGSLNPGEVALYQECGFQGKATVFATDIPDFGALDSPAITLNNTARAVRVGPDTSMRLYSGSGYSGTPQVITADTACLTGQPDTASIDIQPARVIRLSSHHCLDCQLQNGNFAGADLSGVDLQGSDLSGANLMGTNLDATNLTGVTLDGANLLCADLSGTPSQPRDLRPLQISANAFSQVPPNSCQTNLSYTIFTLDIVPASAWKLLNLTGATILGLSGQVLSTQSQPLDLTSAKLAGASLGFAILDYAKMAGADLTRTNLNHASLRHADLSSGLLYGANLTEANLDDAVLRNVYLTKPPTGGGGAAVLQGAYLRNVNLAQSHLSGANFTNASFYGVTAAGTATCAFDPQTGITGGCATAAGANMDNTSFADAYLFGVDFSGASGNGTQFGNAFLVGANFDEATITVDASSGTSAGFGGAFLQGTNLGPASLTNISLSGAYVDFRTDGNVLTLLLSGQHTAFAGSKYAGAPVCAKMSYNNPTTAPANNASLTCPNGQQFSTGCGILDGSNSNWNSGIPLPNSLATYEHDASFTKAPANGQQVCQPDTEWNL